MTTPTSPTPHPLGSRRIRMEIWDEQLGEWVPLPATTNVPAPVPARVTPSSSSPASDLSQASPAAVERLHQGMEVGRVCYPVPLNDRNPDVLRCVSHRGDWTERGCREAVRLADLAVGGEVGALRAEIERLRGQIDAWHISGRDQFDRAEAAEAEVERWQQACTEFENAYVGEREDRVKAEARLRKVEALADEWAARWDVPKPGRFDPDAKAYRDAAAHLRATLAAEPAEVTPPAEQRARHHHSRKAMECCHNGSDCCGECCEPGGVRTEGGA